MANQIPQPDAALHTASHLMQYHDLIESIVAAMDARDAYTAKHSDRHGTGAGHRPGFERG